MVVTTGLWVAGAWRVVLGAEREPAPDGLGLVVAGTWSDTQAERVRAFVERNTSVAVRLRPDPVPPANEPLVDLRDGLQVERHPEDAALVVLYNGAGTFEPHSVYDYDAVVAIINLPVIAHDDEETFLRRVEKLTIRSFGLLLDVPLVPNPHSALWTYRTTEELDFMGRNFDPPSLLRFQENAAALGIPLLSKSPFLLLREE